MVLAKPGSAHVWILVICTGFKIPEAYLYLQKGEVLRLQAAHTSCVPAEVRRLLGVTLNIPLTPYSVHPLQLLLSPALVPPLPGFLGPNSSSVYLVSTQEGTHG